MIKESILVTTQFIDDKTKLTHEKVGLGPQPIQLFYICTLQYRELLLVRGSGSSQ